VLQVVGRLLFAATVGLVDGALHGVSHLVREQYGAALQVAGGAAYGLDEGAPGAEEAFLVGVQDRDQTDLS
jgi:hypothetical protein